MIEKIKYNLLLNFFKNKKYLVIKNAISKELATFNYNYLLMKQQVHKTLTETNLYIYNYKLISKLAIIKHNKKLKIAN